MRGGLGVFFLLWMVSRVPAALVEDPVLYEHLKEQVSAPVRFALQAAPANGDFSSGLSSWTAEGSVSSASGEAILNDRVSPTSLLFQPVSLAPGTYVLQFDVTGNFAPNPGSGFFPDTFFATLYATTNPSSLDIRSGLFDDATPLLDADVNGYLPAVGTVSPSPLGGDWVRYAVTFQSTLGYVVPAFEFVDADGTAGNSEVRVDNVTIVVPEPATLFLSVTGLALLLMWRRRCAALLLFLLLGTAGAGAQEMQSLSDHILVRTANERTTLDRRTGELVSSVDVTLVNLGGREVLPPLHAVLNLSTSGVTVVGALGGPTAAPYNRYYFDLSTQLTAGRFAAQDSLTFPLTFRRGRNTIVSYEVEPYGFLKPERAPTLVVAPGPYTLLEGGLLQVAVSASDPDGDVVTLSGLPAVSNAAFVAQAGVSASGLFTFQPNFEQAGLYTLQFTATDPLGLSASSNLSVVVSNVNQAPVAQTLPNQIVDEGGLLTVPLDITDPDGDALTITPLGMPTNAMFNPEAQTFFWLPGYEQAGHYTPSFIASDGAASVTQHLDLTVVDVPVALPGETNTFALNVDPIQSPTLQQRLRVTGNVNGSTNGPAVQPFTTAIINGVVPSTGTRGQTTNVLLTGQGSGPFAVHFVTGSSVPNFGEGIGVNSVTVLSPTQLVANVSINAAAALGARAPSVQTDTEFAPAIVAFNVLKGETSLSGRVVDFNTTNAIAGALVSIEGTSLFTTTGLDGSFTLHDLPPGAQVLIINSPDHGLIRVTVNGDDPNAQQLGDIPATATVFDPSAPASVSLLSILGRGFGSITVTDLEKTKQAIRDGMILMGGSEAGLLDEYGNQLNPGLAGTGLNSLTELGVRILAERTQRGETVSLAETLLPFSFAFSWTNGPALTLQDWLDGLQAGVNRAWADPQNPSNYLAQLVFNSGKTLSSTPPILSPETRLTPAQNYAFVMSMLSYMADPEGTIIVARVEQPLPEHRHTWMDFVAPPAWADPLPGDPSSGRRWTSYWRGFNGVKNNFMNFQLNSAYQDYASLAMLTMVAAASGSPALAIFPLTIAGLVETRIELTFGTIEIAQRVPEPPKVLEAEVVPGGRGPAVRVKIRRSPSDPGTDSRYVYSLYRFRASNEGRQLVAFGRTNITHSTDPNVLEAVDLEPFPGSTFYAATLTRLFRADDALSPNQANNAVPWWNLPNAGINDPVFNFLRSTQKLVSDYSDPLLFYLGSPAASIPTADIEVDPHSDDVYYSDKSGTADQRKILRIGNLGDGDATVLAYTQFADPGQEGLAVDRQGNVYSHNLASDSLFGGRLFQFNHTTGARDFVGSINYYSRDLLFANPVDGRTMDFGPAGTPSVSDEDLFSVDMVAGQLKRAPVKATYDPYRRIAQPYAPVPFDGRPIDMEHDAAGNMYVLIADAEPRLPFLDKEKGPMSIPPGAPVKTDCPPEEADPFVDPVYLFSGEFYEDAEDIRIRGIGLDFVWTRKYRSKIGITNSVQGNNWDYSYNIYIETNAATNIVVHDGHTRTDEYQKSPTNNLWTLHEFFRELQKNGDGTYTLEFEDKGAWIFNAFTGSPSDGRVKQSVDRHGNTLSFFYDGLGRLERVNDTLGRDILVAYNAQGFISDITDFTGRTWHYTYCGAGDPDGNPGDLKSVRSPLVTGTSTGNDFPLGKTISYTYSKGFADPRLNGNLLTMTDGRRNDPNDPTYGQGPYLRNIYATNTSPTDLDFDRVVRQVWGDSGDIIDLFYETVNPTVANGGSVEKTIVNDRVGNVKEYFHNYQNQVTIRREYTGRAIANQRTTETENRPANKLRATDPDYFETQYVWNSDSLKKREIHPNGNITEYVYESDLDAAAPARTRGNIREIHHLPGTYATVGDQTNIVETFEYDTSFGRGCCGFNFVTRHTDGRGNEVRSFYDAVGNKTSVVNRITSIREDYQYDARGRLLRAISPDNGSGHRRVDRMVYYGIGDGIQNGYLKQKIVDEGGLNLTTTYEYDARGNSIRMIDARGNDTLYEVNALDQAIRIRSPLSPAGARYRTDTYYDANNNVVKIENDNFDENGVLQLNAVFTTLMEYDILDCLTRKSIEVDEGRFVVNEFQYDRNRNMILSRPGEAVNGHQTANLARTQYDERDLVFRLVQAESDPGKCTTQTDYDPNGNVLRVIDGLEKDPRTTTYTYDAYDRKISETDMMGNRTEWHYDPNNQPVRIVHYGELVDGVGSASNVRLSEMFSNYDAMDRCTNTIQLLFDTATQLPIGSGQVVCETTYNDCSQVVRMKDDNGHVSQTVYDGANRALTITDHLTNTLTQTYDNNGNLIVSVAQERSDSDALVETFVTSNTYDALDRMIRTVDTAGNTNRMAYDSRHNLVVATDARGNVTRHEYDGLNRVVRSLRFLTDTGDGSGVVATQLVTRMTWDDSSRLVATTDDNGNTLAQVFDPLNRIIQTTLPDGRSSRMVYDVRGNIVTNIDPNGTVVKYTYDLDDRLLRKDVTAGAGVATNTTFETFGYDGLSRLVRAEDDDSVVERTFDSMARMTRETLNGLAVQYEQDGMGNETRVVYPGGRVVTNVYDALNRKKTIGDGVQTLAAYSYIGVSRVTRRTNGNNTEERFVYDNVRRITRSTHVLNPAGSATPFDDRTYTWDRVFNKTSRQSLLDAVTHTYQYDSLNRLVRSTKTGPETIAYALDGVGNRLAVTGGPSAGVYSLSALFPNPADRQVNQYTATPFDARVYDDNGNLTGINTGLVDAVALSFDFRNQLVGYSNAASGVAVRFAYDVFGRRIAKTALAPVPSVTKYVYQGSGIIEERNASNTVVATYVYGNMVDERISMRRGGQDYFYHGDDLQNVMKLTDATGAVAEKYDYDDYGAPVIRSPANAVLVQSAVGNPYLFNGREYDPETGLYYYRTRYLDPRTGRFLSRDRLGSWGDAKNLGNAFSYAGNNPWTMVDPYGEDAYEMTAGVAGGGLSFAADTGLGLVSLGSAVVYGSAYFCRHPFQSIGAIPGAVAGGWNGMCATFTRVAAHPDGVMAGWVQELAPDLIRSGHCWEFMSDYQRGHQLGRTGAGVLSAAVGVLRLGQAAHAARLARLARMAEGGAGGPMFATIDPSTGRYVHGPTALEPSEIAKRMRGFTKNADELADYIEQGKIKIEFMESYELKRLWRLKGGGGGGKFTPGGFAQGRVIYLSKNMAKNDIFRKVVHEGNHVVNIAKGVAKSSSRIEVMLEEVRAWTAEYQFAHAAGLVSKMPSTGEIWSMIVHHYTPVVSHLPLH